MSFHLSAQNLRLEGSTLISTLANVEGQENDASIDLNSIIGNEDGRFFWGGADFASSAENISLSIEGGDNVPVLRAQLRNAEGELVDADLNLGERLGNNDGQFVLI
ncbi:related to Cyanovirin-N homolog [Phialocephala subalpina]|uniref:Related to Cyanovirin-N homolog n=1 Tax=Phialocephala subalpina TaxID=576137 RepID=A0A1L7XS91_9HELO|nr:related to Cyanovirin-N homolog [Phialocephala subalpina]